MITVEQIRGFSDRVAREFAPERIILFGSYAYGSPTPDSDVDILVVVRHQGRSWEKASEIRMKVRAGFPLDLVVRDPENMRERLELGDPFLREIADNGRILYESPDY